MRERERFVAALKSKEKSGKDASEQGDDQTPTVPDQKILVLDRGFVGWQEAYGTDERLTEGYRKELWEEGY
jgi:Cdc25 family phosphatase